MWPVKVNFKVPLAKSQNFMTLSVPPVANQLLEVSTSIALTHPLTII